MGGPQERSHKRVLSWESQHTLRRKRHIGLMTLISPLSSSFNDNCDQQQHLPYKKSFNQYKPRQIATSVEYLMSEAHPDQNYHHQLIIINRFHFLSLQIMTKSWLSSQSRSSCSWCQCVTRHTGGEYWVGSKQSTGGERHFHSQPLGFTSFSSNIIILMEIINTIKVDIIIQHWRSYKALQQYRGILHHKDLEIEIPLSHFLVQKEIICSENFLLPK